MIVSVLYLALCVLMIVSLWKIFEKCGEPGWASIIPIYNIYIMLRIVGWEPIKLIFFFIPIVNIYFAFLLYKELAAKFGKNDIGFVVGMLLLPFIFLPMLAFKEEVVA